ncbi:MAG: hypothetical protein ACREOO_10465 [bacterium]
MRVSGQPVFHVEPVSEARKKHSMNDRNRTIPVLAAFVLLQAQILYSQIASDLRVNDEPDTSAFIARNPSLHVFSPERFLVVSEDDRWDEPGFQASFFDGQGHQATKYFSILGNENVLPEENDEFMVLSHFYEVGPVPPEDFWVGYRQRYRGVQPISALEAIDRFTFPIDVLGDVGSGSDLLRTRWGSAYVVNFLGTMFLRKFDRNDREIGVARQMSYEAIRDFSACLSPDSLRAWVLLRTSMPTGAPSLPIGLHFAEIDIETESSGVRVLLPDPSFGKLNISRLHTQALNDSTITAIYAQGDSLLELQLGINGSGHAHRAWAVPRLPWPGVPNTSLIPTALLVSNPRQGRRKLLLGFTESRAEGTTTQSRSVLAAYTLGEDSLIAEPPRVMLLPGNAELAQRGQAFLMDDGELYVPATIHPHNHLLKIQNGEIRELRQLADLPAGAHQTWPAILPEAGNNFWISWNEGPAYRGRRLDANGQLFSASQKLPDRDGLFMQNGRFFVTKTRHPFSSSSTRLQIRELEKQYLLYEIEVPGFWHSTLLRKLDEERFFVFYFSPPFARLDVLNAITGSKEDSLLIFPETNSAGELRTMPLPDGRYWLNVPDRQYWTRPGAFFLWNPRAKQISAPIVSPPEILVWPVTADRFLVANSSDDLARITFGLKDTTGQVIAVERMLTADGSTFPLAAWPLPRDHFLIFLRVENAGQTAARKFLLLAN